VNFVVKFVVCKGDLKDVQDIIVSYSYILVYFRYNYKGEADEKAKFCDKFV
jgi:hypothetical protein